MASLKLLAIFGGLMSLLSPALVGFTPLPSSSPSVPSSSSQWISLTFPKGPLSSPQSTAGGGVRGTPFPCTAKDQTPPTALLPPDKLGTTALASPSLFIYIPTTLATQGELMITDHKGEEFYQSAVALPARSGVIKVSLPEDKTLQMWEKYRWQFKLSCQVNGQPKEELLRGRLQRVELPPDVQAELRGANTLKKAELLAQAEVWLDTLSTLSESYDRYQTDWQELLTSVGLESIATAPLVQ